MIRYRFLKKLAISLVLGTCATYGSQAINLPTVHAVNYKYTDRFYKVKLLRKTEVDKSKHPYIKIGDVYNTWKYLPSGSIVYVKSNGSNVSWSVKSSQLRGKYWVTDYNSKDYSWFSTNLKAFLPRNTYNAHGFIVRQTLNTISLTNKYGKATIYTNTIQLYHFPHTGGTTRNTAYIKAKFTNKSSNPRIAAHFIDDYFNIRKINKKTLSVFDPSSSSAHAPNATVMHSSDHAFSAVRPHKTITCTIASDLSGGLHSKQKFVFQPQDLYGHKLGKPKYARGSKLHYSDDYTESNEYIFGDDE